MNFIKRFREWYFRNESAEEKEARRYREVLIKAAREADIKYATHPKYAERRKQQALLAAELPKDVWIVRVIAWLLGFIPSPRYTHRWAEGVRQTRLYDKELVKIDNEYKLKYQEALDVASLRECYSDYIAARIFLFQKYPKSLQSSEERRKYAEILRQKDQKGTDNLADRISQALYRLGDPLVKTRKERRVEAKKRRQETWDSVYALPHEMSND